jgi:hypothetical protein
MYLHQNPDFLLEIFDHCPLPAIDPACQAKKNEFGGIHGDKMPIFV